MIPLQTNSFPEKELQVIANGFGLDFNAAVCRLKGMINRTQ